MYTLSEYDLNRWINKYWVYLIIRRKGIMKRLSRDDIRKNAEIIGHMQETARIYNNYKILIEKKYQISINIIDCWQYCTKNYGVNFIGFHEKRIIKYIVAYAQEQKKSFNKLSDEVNIEKLDLDLETVSIHSNEIDHSPTTFEELISNPIRKKIIFEAMLYLNIINISGKGILKDNQKGQLAGFIDSLIDNNLIPDYTDIILHKIFCSMLGLSYTRLKRESKQYDNMKDKTDEYLKKHTQGL